MYSLWYVWLFKILSTYFNIFSKFSFYINFLSFYVGIYLAWFKSLSKNYFYSSSTFCCYWLNYIWICALAPFREFEFPCEESFFLELSFCLDSVLLLFVEIWTSPVFPVASPCFLLLVFLSLSFNFEKYSAAPGTGNLLWMSIASLLRDRVENGFIKSSENYWSTLFLISSCKISYSVFCYILTTSSMSHAEAKTPV